MAAGTYPGQIKFLIYTSIAGGDDIVFTTTSIPQLQLSGADTTCTANTGATGVMFTWDGTNWRCATNEKSAARIAFS
jgi:hypothetical protein